MAPSALPVTWPAGDVFDGVQDRGKALSPGEPAIGESPAAPASRALLIFDPAIALACAVAAQARRNGEFALPLEGDAGTFWYRSILPLLQQDARAPAPGGFTPENLGSGAPGPHNGDVFEHRIAMTGLTPHAAFFVLSTLAMGAGMGVSSRRLIGADDDPHLVAWHFELRMTA
ncbi:hypothetical protein [Pararobbsia alpina]|nr:hypothetical protein [Pararobbsia alpina]